MEQVLKLRPQFQSSFFGQKVLKSYPALQQERRGPFLFGGQNNVRSLFLKNEQLHVYSPNCWIGERNNACTPHVAEQS